MHLFRSHNNLDLKPFDLDTLFNLKDLQIAQLAHHLRPIFGLVLTISTLQIQSKFFFVSAPLYPKPGFADQTLASLGSLCDLFCEERLRSRRFGPSYTFKGQRQLIPAAGILANTASHCFGSSEDKYAVFSHSV